VNAGATTQVTIMESTSEKRRLRKQRQGVVVSDVQDKTIVVRVSRRTAHKLYRKVITRSKKYHVHDPENTAKIGDTVQIEECRPLSKLKRWRLDKVIRRAEG
jgi:small subunit ribosomal protein S17